MAIGNLMLRVTIAPLGLQLGGRVEIGPAPCKPADFSVDGNCVGAAAYIGVQLYNPMGWYLSVDIEPITVGKILRMLQLGDLAAKLPGRILHSGFEERFHFSFALAPHPLPDNTVVPRGLVIQGTLNVLDFFRVKVDIQITPSERFFIHVEMLDAIELGPLKVRAFDTQSSSL